MTLSLDRSIALLDALLERPREGNTLTGLASATGLSKATAHRLLGSLRVKGLVDYEQSRRLFLPGLRLFRMGLAAAMRFDVVDLAAGPMDRLAAQTGDTIYLSIRSGDDAVCVARRVGAFPIKTLTLDVGDVRPLGLGAGSLALLASLPDAEAEAIIHRNRARMAPHRHFDVSSLRQLVARTRRSGHALNDGLMLPEMAAIAMAVRQSNGSVCAALSVAAIRSRIQDGRREAILKMLRREAVALEAALGFPATVKAAA